MAHGIPGKVLAIQEDELRTGRVAFGDEEQDVSLALLEDVQIGDYVLVQAGSAIQTVTEKQAREIFALLKEMGSEGDSQT